MAGLKLKSGADLCGFELNRFCVQNDVAIPDAPASGRKYFHKGTGEVDGFSMANRERIYTGSSWRATAYLDDLADLDVASNASFKELEEKVKLLSGEVDTDAIISNMKEVSNFLAGFAEDANLMSALDGKLNKTGGTIFSGAFDPLKIKGNSSYSGIGFERGENKAGYLVYTGGVDWFVTNEGWGIGHKIIHSGNVEGYALPLTGGTMSGNLNLNVSKLIWHGAEGYSISCPNTATAARLQYAAYDGHLFQSAVGQAMLINSSGNVTIGSSDLAGTSANLVVGNNVIFCYNQSIKGGVDNGNFIIDAGDYSGWFAKGFGIKHNGTTLGQYGFYLGESNLQYMFIGKYDSPWISIRPNGNVGIGTPDPQHKLHVVGGIVATGTIACKGIAAEGDAMDMVDKTVLHIPSSTTQQTFTLNHGLGTREITVSIYETTTLGTNMILTDVEIVDDNNISVSFGNPPTENHMVVVMG